MFSIVSVAIMYLLLVVDHCHEMSLYAHVDVCGGKTGW
jgi:hypothetical protein